MGGPQGRFGRVQKVSPLCLSGIRSPDRLARSESLYRQSYCGPIFDFTKWKERKSIVDIAKKCSDAIIEHRIVVLPSLQCSTCKWLFWLTMPLHFLTTASLLNKYYEYFFVQTLLPAREGQKDISSLKIFCFFLWTKQKMRGVLSVRNVIE